MEDFKLSRDYPAAFAEAKRIKNIDEMSLVFEALCSEIGLPNAQLDQAGAEAGRRAALYLNARENNTSFEGSVPGKKV